jgi:small GTP-binding protein
MTTDPAVRFKIVMVGDSGVGKTAIVSRMSEGTFLPGHIPTVGAQFVTGNLSIDGNRLPFELWDTAGQEVYRSLVGFYARDARGALLVVDVTSRQSFDSLAEWLKFVRGESPGVKLVLFANKIDMVEQRVLTNEVLKAFADQNGLDLFQGSAKTGQAVPDAFERLGDLMWKQAAEEKPVESAQSSSIAIGQGLQRQKSGCC